MKIKNLFSRKKIRLEKVKLDMNEYDKLIDSKLQGIRKFIRSNIQLRENDDLFSKQFEEAFLKYEQAIKKQICCEGDVGKIMVSPFSILENLYRAKPKVPWYKRKISIKRFFRRIKFKLQLYWRHIMLLREIRKIKRLFPNLSNQHAISLINASKLNKRMLVKNL